MLEHVRTWTVCVLSENVNIRHWIVSIKLESWPAARAGKCNPLLNTNKNPLGFWWKSFKLFLLKGVFIPLWIELVVWHIHSTEKSDPSNKCLFLCEIVFWQYFLFIPVVVWQVWPIQYLHARVRRSVWLTVDLDTRLTWTQHSWSQAPPGLVTTTLVTLDPIIHWQMNSSSRDNWNYN